MDKIICLGKNYSEHAKEMGEAAPEKPVIFLKPPSVLVVVEKNEGRARVALPQGKGQVHPECEIVLRLGKNHQIEAVTLGLDVTLRDVQSELKKRGQPWTVSKVFRDSAIVGPWIMVSEFPNWENTEFRFELEDEIRQKGSAQEMTLKVSHIVAYISEFFPLCEGDLIFTGTPKGVGPVQSGSNGKLKWGKLNFSVSWS